MSEKVTVYTKPHCVQCQMTKNQLEKLGVDYETVDIATDPEALHLIKDEWGFLQAPVVASGEVRFSGFQPKKLKELAAA